LLRSRDGAHFLDQLIKLVLEDSFVHRYTPLSG
jgi:hypothetical protein